MYAEVGDLIEFYDRSDVLWTTFKVLKWLETPIESIVVTSRKVYNIGLSTHIWTTKVEIHLVVSGRFLVHFDENWAAGSHGAEETGNSNLAKLFLLDLFNGNANL